MTIIEALVQLRNDLKLWVTNNLRVKVDKVEGMGLSSNDYTTAEKNKLAGLSIESLATVVYVDEELSKKADSLHFHNQYLEASDIEDLATEEYVIQAIAEAQLAEGEVDLSAYYTKTETDTKIDESIENAITEAKTDASNKDAAVLFEAQKSIGAVQTALDTHTSETNIHITNNERTAWNDKADKTYVDEEIATAINEVKADSSNKDAAVLFEVQSTLTNYYTKAEIDSLELITIADIDAICRVTA